MDSDTWFFRSSPSRYCCRLCNSRFQLFYSETIPQSLFQQFRPSSGNSAQGASNSDSNNLPTEAARFELECFSIFECSFCKNAVISNQLFFGSPRSVSKSHSDELPCETLAAKTAVAAMKPELEPHGNVSMPLAENLALLQLESTLTRGAAWCTRPLPLFSRSTWRRSSLPAATAALNGYQCTGLFA